MDALAAWECSHKNEIECAARQLASVKKHIRTCAEQGKPLASYRLQHSDGDFIFNQRWWQRTKNHLKLNFVWDSVVSSLQAEGYKITLKPDEYCYSIILHISWEI